MAGGTNFGDDQDEGITGINIVPLVDVVLVLLIIFMVTTHFVQEDLRNRIPPNVKIELPKAASATETHPTLISVVMDRRGRLFLNGTESSPQALRDHVSELKAKGKKLEAIVTADRRLSHGQVIAVIDILRVMGVPDVAVNTRRQEIE